MPYYFSEYLFLSNAVDSLGQTGDLSGNGVLMIYTLCPSFRNLNDGSLQSCLSCLSVLLLDRGT